MNFVDDILYDYWKEQKNWTGKKLKDIKKISWFLFALMVVGGICTIFFIIQYIIFGTEVWRMYISAGFVVLALFGPMLIKRKSFLENKEYYHRRAKKMKKFLEKQGFINRRAKKYIKEIMEKKLVEERQKADKRRHFLEVVFCSISIPVLLTVLAAIFDKTTNMTELVSFIYVGFVFILELVGLCISVNPKGYHITKTEKLEKFLVDLETINMVKKIDFKNSK